MKPLLNVTFALVFALTTLFAATPGAAAATANSAANGQNTMRSPKKPLSVIVLAGVAGAVLGLSTLSFYGRPQDRLSNIAFGAALGIIGGASYTTFKAATQPRNFYDSRAYAPAAGDELLAAQAQAQRASERSAPNLGFNFQF